MSSREQRRALQQKALSEAKQRREGVMALQVKIDEDRKAREEAAAGKRDAERRAKLESDVKRAFLEAGGTEADFEISGPKLIRENVEAVTADRMARDRQAVRNRISQLL